MLTIQNNPTDTSYEALLDLAFKECEEFQLVVRTDILKYQDSFKDLKTWFSDSFTEVHAQHEWPQQISLMILRQFIILKRHEKRYKP